VTSDRVPVAAGILLVFCGLSLAIVSLSWPLGWDQSVFAWVGDTVLRGGYPYRDAFDTKGPATYVPFILGQAAFGRQAWAIRVFDLVLLGLAAVPIRNALVRLGQRRAVPLALGLILTWFYAQGYWNTAQPDAWAALLGAVAASLFLGRTSPPRLGSAVLIGLVLGVAVLLKPLYIVFALVPVAGVLLDEGTPGTERALVLGAGFLGTLMALLAVGSIFLAGGALHGLLTEMTGGGAYAAANAGYDAGASIHALIHYLRQTRTLLAVSAAFAGFVALWSTRRLDAVILAFWLAAALAVPAMLGRWQGYDMHALQIVLAVLAGIGIAAAWDTASGPARALLGLFIALLILASVRSIVPHVRDWARWRSGNETEADYARHFDRSWRNYSYRSSALIADYIARHSGPEDRVLAVENPLINYLSDRAAPGRFVSARPAWGTETPFDSVRRAEFNASLVEGQPSWIVIGPPAQYADTLVDGIPVTRSIGPAFAAGLRERYRLEVHCEHYYLFRRTTRDSAAAVPASEAGPGPSCASLRQNDPAN